MKITQIEAYGNSSANATNSLLDEPLMQLLESFDNVTFVEKFEYSSELYRWIYEIEDFDNFYLVIQKESGVNTTITIKVFLKDNIYTNNYLLTITSSSTSETISSYLYRATANIYIVSKNNKLLAFAFMNTTTSISNQFVVFCQQDKNYVISQSGSTIYTYTDDANGTRHLLNTYLLPQYIINEKSLKRNALITETNSSTSPFVDILNNLYHFINSQFLAMSMACIEVDGVRYRQVFNNYLFIEDGDTE